MVVVYSGLSGKGSERIGNESIGRGLVGGKEKGILLKVYRRYLIQEKGGREEKADVRSFRYDEIGMGIVGCRSKRLRRNGNVRRKDLNPILHQYRSKES